MDQRDGSPTTGSDSAATSAAPCSAASSGSGAGGRGTSTAAACGDDEHGARRDGEEPGAQSEDEPMIGKATEAEIVRLYRNEGWPPGTIAAQLGVHWDVVMRVLKDAASSAPGAAPLRTRPRRIDPYLPFIREALEKYPRLRASRLFVMCKARGYLGSPHHFRHQVATLRPRPKAEAFLRLSRFPGEQAQVDWAYFGKLTVGRRVWPLVGLLLVLAWSRRIFLRFFLGLRQPLFLWGQTEAFFVFGGVPRVLLFDNAKVVVLERRGDAIRFHPELVAFARHYGFEPRVAAPYRGNEKGAVERAVRYVRDAFFAARRFDDLDDLNHQARAWCEAEAKERKWRPHESLSVQQAFEQERAHLLPLPAERYPTDERVAVKVGKTPYVRFDKNDYSVPQECVGQVLTVLASDRWVRVLKDAVEVAIHRRSFDHGQQIEDPAHIDALWQQKRFARKHRAQDRLSRAAPSSERLLVELAQRGENLGSACARLLRLLEEHGAARLEKAIAEALAKDSPHPNSVRFLLERMREEEGTAPRVPIALPDDPRVQNLTVRPHDLQSYDGLLTPEPEEDPERPAENPGEDQRHEQS